MCSTDSWSSSEPPRCAGTYFLAANPDHEILDEEGETIHTGAHLPVYENGRSPKIPASLRARRPGRAAGGYADDSRGFAAAPSGNADQLGCMRRTFRRSTPISLNAFSTAAHRRSSRAFLFQMGVMARRRAALAGPKAGTIRRRSHSRLGPAGVAVQKLTPGRRTPFG